MSRKRRSDSEMSYDATPGASSSDVSMQGSRSTIRGGSLMQIEEESEKDANTLSREKKIRILTALDMDPNHRQRIHALEDQLASRNTELNSAFSEVKSRDTLITSLQRKISSMHISIEEMKERVRQEEVLNQGAYAKARELDEKHKQLLQTNIDLIARVHCRETEVEDMQERISNLQNERMQNVFSSSTVDTLEVECHDLKSQITVLIDANLKLSTANTELQHKTEALDQLTHKLRNVDIAKLEASLNGSFTKCKDLERSVETLKRHNTEMDHKSSRSSSEIKRLIDENNLLRSNIIDTQNAQVSLQSKYMKEQSDHELAKKQHYQVDHERNLLEEDNQQLSNDLGLLKEDLVILETKYKNLTDSYDLLEKNHQISGKALHNKEREAENLTTIHDQSVAAHEIQLWQKEQELQRLQQSLDETIKSKTTQDTDFKNEYAELQALYNKVSSELKTQATEISQKFRQVDSEKELLILQAADDHHKVQKLTQEKEELVLEVIACHQKAEELAQKKEQLVQQLEDNAAAAENLANDKATLDRQLAENASTALKKIQDLEKERAKLVFLSEQQELEVQRLQKDNAATVQKLTDEKNELKQQLVGEGAIASQKIQDLANETGAQAQELAKQYQITQNLASEKAKLKQQLADDAAVVLRRIQELENEQAKLVHLSEQQELEVQRLQKDNAATVQKLTDEKNELNQQLVGEGAIASQKIQDLADETGAQAQELAKQYQITQNLASEKAKLKQQLADDAAVVLRRIQELENEHAKLENEHAKLVHLSEQQELEVQRLQKDNAATVQKLINEKNELNERLMLIDEKNELERQLANERAAASQKIQELIDEKENQARQLAEHCQIAENLANEKEKLERQVADDAQRIQELDHKRATLAQQLEQREVEAQCLQETETHDEDHWIPRPRFDILSGRLDASKALNEKTQAELQEKKHELETAVQRWNDFAAESQDVRFQLTIKNREVSTLEGEKIRLETVIGELKANSAKTTMNVAVPDEISVLQQDNLTKGLEIQKLQRELQALSSGTYWVSSPASGCAPQMSIPTPRSTPTCIQTHTQNHTQIRAPNHTPTRTPTPVMPMNGDLAHDMRVTGGLGRTLANAPVQAELDRIRRNRPRWILPKPLNSGKNTGQQTNNRYPQLKPWEKAKPSPYIKSRQSNERPANYLDGEDAEDYTDDEIEQWPANGPDLSSGLSNKGKAKQTPSGHESTENEEQSFGADDEDEQGQGGRQPLDDENAQENDDSRVQGIWQKKGFEEYDPRRVKQHVNMLARDLLYEGFNVRNIWAIFARDGVSQDRLELHIKDPIRHGPKLRNTRIDKYAPDTKTMKQTPWNRALVHKFAAKASDIVANCVDKRFGPDTIDWVRLFSDRFYDIFKQVIKARRQPGESHEARILRLVLDDNNRKERNAKVSLRHAKRTTRSKVAAYMVKICRERGDQEGVVFWSHALNVTEIIGDAGQSEEEDASIDVEIEGVMMKQNVKKVSRLYWREPGIETMYISVDSAPGVEEGLFQRAGAPRIQRIRTDKIDHRLPPPNLPRSVFREEYLTALMPYELDELKLADYTIEVYDFKGYNPNTLPDDEAMDTN